LRAAKMINTNILELGSMPYKKVLDKMMFVKQRLLNLINYTVNKNCIFIHVTVKDKIPFGTPLEPQYQWFIDQVL
jgi:dTDP-D-glucose 4,6-dehydratase